MNIYKIATIQEHPELKNRAANWFHEKWNIPLEAYLESMEACITKCKCGSTMVCSPIGG